jgi:hypothetical protein
MGVHHATDFPGVYLWNLVHLFDRGGRVDLTHIGCLGIQRPRRPGRVPNSISGRTAAREIPLKFGWQE